MARNIDRDLTEFANSLTVEQVIQLYEFIAPMTAAEREQYDAMSDDELLAALEA